MELRSDLLFLPAAFRAGTVFVERYATEWAAVDCAFYFIFLAGCIDTACEGDFCDVKFVFEKVIDHLYHAFYGHCLFGDDETAIRVGGAKFG